MMNEMDVEYWNHTFSESIAFSPDNTPLKIVSINGDGVVQTDKGEYPLSQIDLTLLPEGTYYSTHYGFTEVLYTNHHQYRGGLNRNAITKPSLLSNDWLLKFIKMYPYPHSLHLNFIHKKIFWKKRQIGYQDDSGVWHHTGILTLASRADHVAERHLLTISR